MSPLPLFSYVCWCLTFVFYVSYTNPSLQSPLSVLFPITHSTEGSLKWDQEIGLHNDSYWHVVVYSYLSFTVKNTRSIRVSVPLLRTRSKCLKDVRLSVVFGLFSGWFMGLRQRPFNVWPWVVDPKCRRFKWGTHGYHEPSRWPGLSYPHL